MKRALSLLLAVLMMLSMFACFTASADSEITLLGVTRYSGTTTYVAKFSAPVHIIESGYCWLRPTNPEASTDQQNPTAIRYIGRDATTSDGKAITSGTTPYYSSEVEFIFSKTPSSAETYGFDIVEYFKETTSDGYISNQVIVGANGEKVKANYKSGIDFLWVPTDAADTGNNYPVHVETADGISLTKIVKDTDSNTFHVTFSKPVHIFEKGYTWLRKGPGNGDGQVNPTSIAYVGTDKQNVGGFDYSSKLDFTFPATSFANDAYGFDIVEYFKESASDGFITPAVAAGLGDELIKANVKDGIDFLWAPADAADTQGKYAPHIEVVSSKIKLESIVKDASSYTFTATFSEPVHIFKNGYVWLRQGPENGAGQINPTSVAYTGSDKQNVGGNDYSSEVTFAFATPSGFSDASVYGFDIVEYFLDDTNAGAISPQVIAGADGKLVASNYTSGIDFLWAPTDAADTQSRYAPHIETAASPYITAESVYKDSGSYTFTVTFSEPVHIFKTGYVWLRQGNLANGTGQLNPASVTYIGDDKQNVGGNDYSSVVRFAFSTPSFTDMNSYGLNIVEYFLDDTNAGAVSPQVIAGIGGKLVAGTTASGGLDFLWMPTDTCDSQGAIPLHIRNMPAELDTAEVIGNKIRLIFKSPVTVNDVAKLKLADGTSGTSFEYGALTETYNLKTYSTVVTADFGKAVAGEFIKILLGAISDKTGSDIKTNEDGAYKAILADVAPDFGEDAKELLTDGAAYSFMNCDTGRMITVGTATEFTLNFEEGANEFSLSSGGKYVSFEGGTATLSDAKSTFTLYINNEFERFQIRIGYSSVLLDNDTGSNTKAALALKSIGCDGIETGWYLTKSGDALPKKVAVVGDSITCGVTPEASSSPAGKPGCRETFSRNLLAEYGRVVFVGSLKHAAGGNTTAINNTTVYDDYLNRHEGHSGWVIHNDPTKAPGADDNNRGIDDDGVYSLTAGGTEERHVRKILQEKYAPDAIFMMIGINDLGMNGYNTAMFSTILSRYKTLTDHILADLPEDGFLTVSSCTPLASGGAWNTSRNAAVSEFNSMIRGLVTDYVEAGEERITFTDNYTYVYNAGPSAISTDNIHPTATGYAAMAQSYTDKFMLLFGEKTHVHAAESEVYLPAEDGHYHVCALCAQHIDVTSHVYSSDLDESCDVCGYEREIVVAEDITVTENTESGVSPWNDIASKIKRVNIEKAVTALGGTAFNGFTALKDVYVMGNPTIDDGVFDEDTEAVFHGWTGSNTQLFCTQGGYTFEKLEEFTAIGYQEGALSKNMFRLAAQMRWADYYETAGYDVTAVGSDGFGHDFNKKLTKTITTVYKSLSAANTNGEAYTAVSAEEDCYLSALAFTGLPEMAEGAKIVFTITPYVTNIYSSEKVYLESVTLVYTKDGIRVPFTTSEDTTEGGEIDWENI